MRKKWILSCFFNFVIASLMGLLLRWMYVSPMEGINFQFLMHGHSHIAMLGWAYLMLYSLIFYSFLPDKAQQKPVYNRLFWVTQFSVLGMMIDFPLQGYAFISILFSTLHIFCSYFFCYLLYKEKPELPHAEKKMLYTALFFMVFSTVGVWCLGPAVGLLGKASDFYQIAIQFFLHFQFNGWFLFAVLALFIKMGKLTLEGKKFKQLYYLLVSATLLSMGLPLSWYISHPVFHWLNAIAVLLQLIASLLFVRASLDRLRAFYESLCILDKIIYAFAFGSLALKILLQLLVIIPELAQLSHQLRHLVIGYIHLSMLGVITGFLLAFCFQNRILDPKNSLQKWGSILFLIGYLTTEILLFLQGLLLYVNQVQIDYYYQQLFVASLCLPIGLLMLSIGFYRSYDQDRQKPI